jgi:maltose alpha-D-glucosyltransferase / alpha-amylase
MIRARGECPEISWGNFTVLRTNAAPVLAIRFDWRHTALVTLHNFSNRSQKVRLKVSGAGGRLLVSVFDHHHSRAHNDDEHHITLDGYGWKWLRVGGMDSTLDRSDLTLTDHEVR